MSKDNHQSRMTVPKFINQKNKRPLVCLTAYHSYTAKIVDPFCDLILVGDSLSMVVYGQESTLNTTLETMIRHGESVVKASKSAMVVIDMPFSSYEKTPEIAFENASKILKETGCTAVKMEGGSYLAPTVSFLSQRGIPVMGHIGLRPQSIHTMGGYKIHGRHEKDSDSLVRDAKILEQSGAFSVVLEGVLEEAASKITNSLSIPTIGIGASVHCDGQILVLEDLLGYNADPAKFVRVYAQFKMLASKAVENYAEDVKNKKFPSCEETYT